MTTIGSFCNGYGKQQKTIGLDSGDVKESMTLFEKRWGRIGPDVMVYLTCAVIGLDGRGVIKTWTEVAVRVRL